MLIDLPKPELTLASASPRRRDLLGLTGWSFSVCSSPVFESATPGEEPEALATRLASSKAQAARQACPDSDVIFAADTLVINKKEILGKPADEAEAIQMLKELRGIVHDVITAIAFDTRDHTTITTLCTSRVPMRDYRDDEIMAYVEGGSPLDKAGAYGIQDSAFHPVDRENFDGCFANVMGLPLCHLVRAMQQLGYEPPGDVPDGCMHFTQYDCTIYPTILRGDT